MLMKTVAVTVCALALASPASAALMRARFTGTFLVGSDQRGVFGPAGASLAGAAFSGLFTYDTSLGDRYTSPASDMVIGGDSYLTTSPILVAQLTVNGITRSFPSQPDNGVVLRDSDYLTISAAQGSGQFLALYANLPVPIGSLTANVKSQKPIDADLEFRDFGPDNGLPQLQSSARSYGLNSITVYSAVPEAGTWGLMLLGFGAIGLVARGQRRRVAV